jgi:hypothetical protein
MTFGLCWASSCRTSIRSEMVELLVNHKKEGRPVGVPAAVGMG